MKMIIKSLNGDIREEEISQDINFTPMQGEQFYFTGVETYHFELSGDNSTINVYFITNEGLKINIVLNDMANLIQQNNPLDPFSPDTIFGVSVNAEGDKLIDEALSNKELQNGEIIDALKEALSLDGSTAASGAIIDDFGFLLDNMAATAAGDGLQNTAYLFEDDRRPEVVELDETTGDIRPENPDILAADDIIRSRGRTFNGGSVSTTIADIEVRGGSLPKSTTDAKTNKIVQNKEERTEDIQAEDEVITTTNQEEEIYGNKAQDTSEEGEKTTVADSVQIAQNDSDEVVSDEKGLKENQENAYEETINNADTEVQDSDGTIVTSSGLMVSVETIDTLTEDDENLSTETVIGNASSTNPDNSEITFTISDTANYEINESTGEITLTQAGLDLVNSGENLPNYTVTANSTSGDSGVSADINPVDTIDVNDDLSLSVTPVETLIEDSVSAGTQIATSSANDEDGGDIIYSIDDTVNYAIDENGKVTLTEAGANIVNAGEDLPNFNVTAQSTTGQTSSSTVEVNPANTTDAGTVTIDTIAGDDIINASESQQDTILVSGTANGGDIAADDPVIVSVNGNDYTTTVQADGAYSVEVNTDDLIADNSVEVDVVSTDDAGNTVTSEVSKDITVDTQAEARDDTATTDEDNSVIIDVLANDDEGLTITSVDTPQNSEGEALGDVAIVTVDEVQQIKFTPAENYNELSQGEDEEVSFTYYTKDEMGNTAEASTTVTITGTNDVPVATDDNFESPQNTSRVFTVNDLLGNDSDVDRNDDLSITAVEQPEHGTVQLIHNEGTGIALNLTGNDQAFFIDSRGVNDEVVGGSKTFDISMDVALVSHKDILEQYEVNHDISPLVSYNVANGDNELIIAVRGNDVIDVFIGNKSIKLDTGKDLYDGEAHQIQVTFDESGRVTLCIDGGEPESKLLSDRENYTFKSDGVLVIGQELDSLYDPDTNSGGKFSANQTAGGIFNGITINSDVIEEQHWDMNSINENGIIDAGGEDHQLLLQAKNDIVIGDALHGTPFDSDLNIPNTTPIEIITGDVVIYTPDKDYNESDSFDYTVSDGHGGEDTATVTLNVTNTNNEILQVSDSDSSANEVTENAANGTYTGVTLNTTDENGDTITYTIENSDAPFRIEQDTGRVVVDGDNKIDFETTQDYTFTVKATSADGSSTTQDITIKVNDISGNQTGTNGEDITDTIRGSGNIQGTSEEENIAGSSGSDTITGGAGNDTITGGTGNDTLKGGAGDDTFVVKQGDGYDVFKGGEGIDKVQAEEGTNTIGIRGSFGAENSIETISGDSDG
ncbi:MAG: hypothetical protein CSA86_02280, partial [Arcobacter sp.]